MRQPYVYTMPESFLGDAGVPARWRVLAVINGFFINGGKCWASNKWFTEQLGIHKDTISQAVADLENLKVIRCIRTRRSRVIVPFSAPEIGANTYLRSVPTPISDRRQHLSNSVSNSVSKLRTPAASAPLQGKHSLRGMEYVDVDEDGREEVRRAKGPKPEGKNKVAIRLQRKFIEMARKNLDVSPVMDMKGYKMCLYAMNTGGLEEAQVVDLFEEWFSLGRPDEETVSITRALSARQIEGYKIRNNVK